MKKVKEDRFSIMNSRVSLRKPTVELKWFDTDYCNTPCAASKKYGEASYYELKQKWISDKGDIEWRLIPIG